MKGMAPLVMPTRCAFAAPAIIGCSARQEAPSSSEGVCISYVDVGKGDCILIQVGESAGLIDTGYANTANETVAFLRNRGVKKLEFVVITHYDRDHIGGMRAIGNAYGIDSLYLPDYQGADKNYQSLMAAIGSLGLTPQSVATEKQLRIGNASMTIKPSGVTYHPSAKGDEGNDNDLSLVVMLIYGNDSFLFTGDLEKEGISVLLDTAPGSFDILKMPRHGQKTSNTDELIDAIRPKVAVITDDEEDPANKKVLKLLDENDVETYRTSIDGTILVHGNGSGSYSITCKKG